MELESEVNRVSQVQKVYYAIISRKLSDDYDGVLNRINMIRYIEKAIKARGGFKDTADFRLKTSRFLTRKGVLLANTLNDLQNRLESP